MFAVLSVTVPSIVSVPGQAHVCDPQWEGNGGLLTLGGTVLRDANRTGEK